MKKICWGLAFGGLLLVSFLLFQGCNGVLPPDSSIVAASLPVSVVSNFHQGSLKVNPTLINGTGGYFTAETSGGSIGHSNMINGSVSPILMYPRTDTGEYAIHIYGTQTDTTPTGYPSMEVFCFLRNNPADLSDPYLYDLSGFTGIQFDIFIGPDDTNSSLGRWFEIGISQDTPAGTNPGGTCVPPYGSNCYNYFNKNLPGPSASWQHIQDPFSVMSIRFTPAPPSTNPVGLTTADYLTGSKVIFGQNVVFETQALFLLWQFSNNGSTQTTYTDVWIDNVAFY